MRVSHVIVRTVATLTLADLAITVIFDRYFPAWSRALAHGSLGKVLTFWTMGTSLLLPLYVGFEAWWMRKCNAALRTLWIDAALAVACFLAYIGVVLYAFGHYVMF
jgi:hypothetical protein